MLRPLTLETALALAPLANNPMVSRWTAKIPHPYTDADARAWVDGIGPDDCEWTLHSKPDHRPIGAVGLRFPEGGETGYLGYWLGEPYWGQGYGTEAARTAVEYGFRTLNVARVRAGRDPDNAATLRIFEKLGFRFVESVDEFLPARERVGETSYYVLEAGQWR